MDLLEFTNIYKIIEKVEPDEVYNLAAELCAGVSRYRS
jgi:GDP-D-mannose dehydratase